MNTNAGVPPLTTYGVPSKLNKKEGQIQKTNSIRQQDGTQLQNQFLRTASCLNQETSQKNCGKSQMQDEYLSEMISQSPPQQHTIAVPSLHPPFIKTHSQPVGNQEQRDKSNLTQEEKQENYNQKEDKNQKYLENQVPFALRNEIKGDSQNRQQDIQFIPGIAATISELIPANHKDFSNAIKKIDQDEEDDEEEEGKSNEFCHVDQILINCESKYERNIQRLQLQEIGKNLSSEKQIENKSDRIKSYREDSQGQQSQQICLDDLDDEEVQSQEDSDGQGEEEKSNTIIPPKENIQQTNSQSQYFLQEATKSLKLSQRQQQKQPQKSKDQDEDDINKNLSEHSGDEAIEHETQIKTMKDRTINPHNKVENKEIQEECYIQIPQSKINQSGSFQNNTSATFNIPQDYVLQDPKGKADAKIRSNHLIQYNVSFGKVINKLSKEEQEQITQKQNEQFKKVEEDTSNKVPGPNLTISRIPSVSSDHYSYEQCDHHQTELCNNEKHWPLSTTNAQLPLQLEEISAETEDKKMYRSKTLPSPQGSEIIMMNPYLDLMSPNQTLFLSPNKEMQSPNQNLTVTKVSQNNSYDLTREQILLSPILNVESMNSYQPQSHQLFSGTSPNSSINNMISQSYKKNDEQLPYFGEEGQVDVSHNNRINFTNKSDGTNEYSNFSSNIGQQQIKRQQDMTTFFGNFKASALYQSFGVTQNYNNLVQMPNSSNVAKPSQNEIQNNYSLSNSKDQDLKQSKKESDYEEWGKGSKPNQPRSNPFKLPSSSAILQNDFKISPKQCHRLLPLSQQFEDSSQIQEKGGHQGKVQSINHKKSSKIHENSLPNQLKQKMNYVNSHQGTHTSLIRAKGRSGLIRTQSGSFEFANEDEDFQADSQYQALMKKISSYSHAACSISPSSQSLSYSARGVQPNHHNIPEMQVLQDDSADEGRRFHINQEYQGSQQCHSEDGGKQQINHGLRSSDHSRSQFFGGTEKNTMTELDKQSNELLHFDSNISQKKLQKLSTQIFMPDQGFSNKPLVQLALKKTKSAATAASLYIPQLEQTPNNNDPKKQMSFQSFQANSSSQTSAICSPSHLNAAGISSFRPNMQLSSESFNLNSQAQNLVNSNNNNQNQGSNNNFFVRRLNNQRKGTLCRSPTISSATGLDLPALKDMQKDSLFQKNITTQLPTLPTSVLPKKNSKENNNIDNTMTNYTVPVAFYFEKRYCQICSMDQPTRSKHCIICKRCVSTFDHHCPWIGICVAQRNHLFFFIYICFQNLTLILGIYKIFVFLESEWSGSKSIFLEGIIFSSIIVTFLFYAFFMTFLLILQHTYYIIKNLTTCKMKEYFDYYITIIIIYLIKGEYYSWEKITYLKEQPRRLGSPFSFGASKNISYFIQATFCVQPYEWQINKLRLPAISNNPRIIL